MPSVLRTDDANFDRMVVECASTSYISSKSILFTSVTTEKPPVPITRPKLISMVTQNEKRIILVMFYSKNRN